MSISIIAAVAENGAIGKDNRLLWKLSADMRLFKSLTTGHHVIMGRKTFESMGGKPLPNRTNIVVTRQMDYEADDCLVCHSLAEAIDMAEEAEDSEIFIIGGAEIYQLGLYMADTMYLTHVHCEANGDAYFPPFDPKSWDMTEKRFYSKDEKNEYDFDFCVYKRVL